MKRIISFLLVLIMLISLVPTAVFAAEISLNSLDSKITVYFTNNGKWRNVKIYYWGSNQETVDWPGKDMSYVNTNNYNEDIYSTQIPSDVTGIVFNNGGSYQTVDVTERIYNGAGWYLQGRSVDLLKYDVGEFEFGQPLENSKKSFNGHTYQVLDYAVTWSEAKKQCEDLGGHLVTINSATENEFLVELSKESIKRNLWIGAKTDGSKYSWVTGEPFSYTNWESGEPNNVDDYQYTAMMYTYRGSYTEGKWNDENENGRNWSGYYLSDFGFICEWDNSTYNPESNFSFIGKLENYVISIALDSYGVNWISQITVDGKKYEVKQGALNLTDARVYKGKEVCLTASEGVVEWISSIDRLYTEPKLSFNYHIDKNYLTYTNGAFPKRKVDIQGGIYNQLLGNSFIPIEVISLIKSKYKLSLSDISISLTSDNSNIIRFKDGLFSEKASITFDLDGSLLAEDIQDFTQTMCFNKGYRFPVTRQEETVNIFCSINSKKDGRVLDTKTITLTLINEDYIKRTDPNSKKNWKKQSMEDLLKQMQMKAKEYPGGLDNLSIELAFAANNIANKIANWNAEYEALSTAYDMSCYVYGLEYPTVADAGEKLLEVIIAESENAEEEMEYELREAVEPLFKNKAFCRFIDWYYKNELQVINGNKKEGSVECPVDVTITDEEGNIVLSFVNDEVIFEAEGVSGYVQDGRKIFYLPTDIDHRVQITATDNGTMDYRITEYSATGDEVVVSYENIVLTKDKVCSGNVVMESMPEEGAYALTEMTLDKLSFSDTSLTLKDSICINFKVNETLFTKVGYENPFILFEVNGEKSVVSDYRILDGEYVFDYIINSPANVDETVKATLYATYDGTIYVSETMEYSLANYCDNSHTWNKGSCFVCGADQPVAYVDGYAISLLGNIGVNYYMTLSDDVIADENAKVVFTLPNGSKKSVAVSSVTPNEDGQYVFTCEVAAKEMTKTITAQVVTSTDKSEVFEYSVQEYADYIITEAEAGNETYTAAAPLVKAMLNYGAYVQKYFGYNTANLANDILEDADKVLPEYVDLSVYSPVITDNDYNIDYYGSALSLKSETAIKHYFKVENEAEIPDFYVNGEMAEAVKKDGLYEVIIKDIPAQSLGGEYIVTAGELSLDYNAFSYGYLALKSSDKNRKDVIRALYEYNLAAKAYLAHE